MICRSKRTWALLSAILDRWNDEDERRIHDIVSYRVQSADTNTVTMCIPLEDHDMKIVNKMLTQGIESELLKEE